MPPGMGEQPFMFWNKRRLTPYWLALGTALAAHALVLTLPWSQGNGPAASDTHLRVRLSASKMARQTVPVPVKAVTTAAGKTTPGQAVRAPKPLVSTAQLARPVVRLHHSSAPPAAKAAKPDKESSKPAGKLAQDTLRAHVKAKPATPEKPPDVAAARKLPARVSQAQSRTADSRPQAGSTGAIRASRSHYRSRLETYLSRFRHYPLMARQEGQQGQVVVHFVMDRGGHILSQQLQRRTPFPLLNREALALLQRAQPLPPPPADLSGVRLAWTLPIDFRLP